MSFNNLRTYTRLKSVILTSDTFNIRHCFLLPGNVKSNLGSYNSVVQQISVGLRNGPQKRGRSIAQRRSRRVPSVSPSPDDTLHHCTSSYNTHCAPSLLIFIFPFFPPSSSVFSFISVNLLFHFPLLTLSMSLLPLFPLYILGFPFL